MVREFHPLDIDKNTKEEICRLHQSVFRLDDEEIIECLSDRDVLFTFVDEKSHKLMGTVAVRWIEHNDKVIVYVGNAVFYEKYQRQNFLSYIVYKVLLKTFIKFPLRTIYFSSAMTTPKAFNICRRFPEHYPRADVKASSEVISVMDTVSKEVCGEGNYSVYDDIFITHSLNKENFQSQDSQFQCS